MKTLKYIFLSCIIAFSMISCEENEFIFPEDAAYVTFKTPDNSDDLVLEKAENDPEIIKIGVAVAMHTGSSATVDFSFSVEGIDNPAVEGVDFEVVNESNTLTFPNGVGIEYIQIRLIDNDIFDSNKEMKIKLLNPSSPVQLGGADVSGNIGTRIEYLFKISDDEDPLTPYKGIWTFSTGTHRVVNHPTDPSKVLIEELFVHSSGTDNLSVIADIDFDAKTITIQGVTPVAVYRDFGNVGENCVICARDALTNAWLADKPIIGHLQDDGSILFETFAGFTDDNLLGGAWWQGFMHWQKQ